MQAVAVCRKGVDWRGALIAVRAEVLPGKFALPGVGQHAPLRRELVAPDERRPIQAAARSELPLRLARQLLFGPGCKGLGVLIGDMDDRMIVPAAEAATRPFGLFPARARHIGPPEADIMQADTARRGGGTPAIRARATSDRCRDTRPGSAGARPR